ncbi:MAG: family 10 glycosylhydrolase [Candidatus Omnitrophica bacterium]|nr:family 10 glycosylhydrolase [Candidatus Omnitrophota bacterium]
MKKRIIFCVLCVLSFIQLPAHCQEASPISILVAQLQEPGPLSTRDEISKLVDLSGKVEARILFVQVYRANKAWFYSRFADSKPYTACLDKLREDPLNLLIKQAHSKGIKVYAWLNLLSLSDNKSAFILQKYGVDVLTRNLKEKKSLDDYKIDDQFFLEPGDTRVRQELCSITQELISAYPGLDGILFDYIRYPDKDPDYGYTKTNIERFKKATGVKDISKSLSIWNDWKRTQVDELLTLLVNKVRSMRPDMRIGSTGCVPFVRAYYEAYQNWPVWVNEGRVDFVLLMSYPKDAAEFNKNIQEAKEKVRDFKNVYIGLPAYKLVHAAKVFRDELQIARSAGAGSYTVFHYNSLLENPSLVNILEEKTAY